jgi:hypothetical protein
MNADYEDAVLILTNQRNTPNAKALTTAQKRSTIPSRIRVYLCSSAVSICGLYLRSISGLSSLSASYLRPYPRFICVPRLPFVCLP